MSFFVDCGRACQYDVTCHAATQTSLRYHVVGVIDMAFLPCGKGRCRTQLSTPSLGGWVLVDTIFFRAAVGLVSSLALLVVVVIPLPGSPGKTVRLSMRCGGAATLTPQAGGTAGRSVLQYGRWAIRAATPLRSTMLFLP